MSPSVCAERFCLFDRIPVGVCVLQRDFTVLFWNDCLENWTRISRSEIVNHDIRDFFPHLSQPKYANRFLAIFEGGPPTIFSSQLHKHIIPASLPNGEFRIQHTTVTALPSTSGKEFHGLMVIQDVTDLTAQSQAYRKMRDRALEEISERKRIEEVLQESEERYAKIFEEGPLGMALIDFDYRYIKVNATLCEMLGYSEVELTSLTLLDLAHPEEVKLDQEYLQQLFHKQRESLKVEQRYLHKQGDIIWMTLTASMIHDQHGKPLYGLVMLEDITERKHSEKALQQANEQLTGWINELETRNNEITLLSEMSDVLQACLNVNEAYGALAQLINPMFPKTSGGVFIINSSLNLVTVVANWGDIFASDQLFTFRECWALRRGRSHWISHRHSGLRCSHLHLHPVSSEALCVPMSAHGEAIGLIYLSSETPGLLSQAKQKLAITVAEHLALALANLKLRETLHNQSIRDPLTGLYNRRHLEESLILEVQKAEKHQQPLGLLMIDIDHFKYFNDTYGHETGDLVLRELSTFLQESIRTSDLAFRYGGEELTLILPHVGLDDTQKRAEQLRKGVKGLEVECLGRILQGITISIGVACFPKHGETWTELIRAADTALYCAKEAGRDRVILAS